MKKLIFALLLSAAYPAGVVADDEQMIITVKRMTMETALKIAQATLASCRKAQFQVGVTVVDRNGIPQVVLRDVLAPDLTLEISYKKAYTTLMFNTPLSILAKQARFQLPFSVGKADNLLVSAGGIPIAAGGTILGGIGVSGAPSGEADEKCAQAGLDAVLDDLEMSF